MSAHDNVSPVIIFFVTISGVPDRIVGGEQSVIAVRDEEYTEVFIQLNFAGIAN